MRYAATLIILLFAAAASASGPDRVSYQGLALDSSGEPLTGTVDLQLGVWSDPISTSPADELYVEVHPGVPVTEGTFSVELGGGNLISGSFDADLFAGGTRWLETAIDGETAQPRHPFLSVPYAFRAQQADSIPSLTGAVMHFALPDCPNGWSEFVPARGRTLVGLPSNGTLEGASGSPLGDLESRQHTHTVSTPTAATSSVGSHAHFVSGRSTTTDTHNHAWTRWNGSLRDWTSFNSSGGEFTITNWTDGMDQAGSGIYPIAGSSSNSRTIYTDRDSHSHTVSSFNTGNNGAHSHSVAGGVATSAPASSNPTLPYLQLLVCVKD